MKIKCFVISFNRLTFLKKQLDYLLNNKQLEVIIIDNNSDVKELLEYYKTLNCEVIYFPENKGHTVVWDSQINKTYCVAEPYIVTDCDVIPDHCKEDYVSILLDGLSKFPDVNKIGLGLNTNNIPFYYKKREEVIKHENKVLYKKNILGSPFYYCPVDTTFAIYRSGYFGYSVWGTDNNFYEGVCKSMRLHKPYEATHLGWHVMDSDEEMQHYFKTSLKTTGHWKV